MTSRFPRSLLVIALAFAGLASSRADSAADAAKNKLAAGRVDEAIAELGGRGSGTAESSNLLCRAYFALEEWDPAQSACKRAVALDPQNGSYHLWLGRVYGEKADRANFLSAASLAGKVREEFERAVQLNPEDVDARLDLAEFYLEAPGIVGGGDDKARAEARSVGKLNAAREHWVYARMAEKKKDYSTAESEYRQYIDLSHGEAEAWLNLAIFLRRQKRYDEMEQAIVKLSRAPMSKPDALVEAAGMLYHTGRNDNFAAELLRRYLNSGPVEAAPAFKARYLLGLVLEKQGEKAAAADEFRASLSLAKNFGIAQQALNRVAH